MTDPRPPVDVSQPQRLAEAVPALPPSALKEALADPRLTNGLLAIIVLCLSGYMPEQFTSLCGA